MPEVAWAASIAQLITAAGVVIGVILTYKNESAGHGLPCINVNKNQPCEELPPLSSSQRVDSGFDAFPLLFHRDT